MKDKNWIKKLCVTIAIVLKAKMKNNGKTLCNGNLIICRKLDKKKSFLENNVLNLVCKSNYF